MSQKQMHLRDYLLVINKRRHLVVVFCVVTITVFTIGTFAMIPLFQGVAKVMIEKEAGSNLIDGVRSSYDPEFYETQMQLINSQSVTRRVVDRLDLTRPDNVYLQTRESSLPTLLGKMFKKKPTVDAEVSLADQIAIDLSQEIVVRPVKNSRIFTISYDHPDPRFAALVVNSVASAYMEQLLDMKMEATRRTMEWMTRKAYEERLKLDKKESELQQYMRSNDLVTLEDRVTVTPQKLTEISTQLVKAEARRKELESLYLKIRDVAANDEEAESILAVTAGDTLQILRDQILRAEQQVSELSGKYGSKHPSMLKAKGDLDMLLAKKKEEIKRLISTVKSEYELAVAGEANLHSQLGRTKVEALDLNEKFVQYGILKREMESNRQLYDTLLLKLKEQSITGENEPVNLWVVEKAQIPADPVKPHKILNLLLGLVVGLFGGVGLAFFCDYFDNTIKSREETERFLGLPVLGLVSLWKEKEGEVERVMLNEPRSAFAESYRALRTSVQLSRASGSPARILVTGPGAGTGKTTTAINLAIALAQSNKKVLLIDADMRKPRLHKLFRKNNVGGLSEYLAGGSDDDLLQTGPLENLSLICSGPIPPNPSELLTSVRMQELLDKQQAHFNVIICDTPPLMAVADARIIAPLFEGSILVVRARKTTFEVAAQGLMLLKESSVPVLGVVINALELKKRDGDYNYYAMTYGEESVSEKGE